VQNPFIERRVKKRERGFKEGHFVYLPLSGKPWTHVKRPPSTQIG